MALHDTFPLPPIVSLRRYGDIINLLPLLRFLFLKTNSTVRLVVHRSFAPVLDGVSYVDPILWDDDMDDPVTAAKALNAINAQVHGKGLQPNRSEGNNFAKHAWRQLGYEWDRHTPLVFNRRDYQREKQLVNAISWARPRVLVKLNGFSSAFKEQEKLWALLRAEFDGLCEFIDLDKLNVERIYDLLGLLDKAACLVSIDTVTLWLARGSRCPVIALTNDLPFLASPPVGNVLVRLPYRDVFRHWDKIAAAIHSTLFEPDGNGIVHVFQDYTPSSQEVKKRNDAARSTWNWGARLLAFVPQRSSRNLGDGRATPFIRDMIQAAISSGSETIIAVSNNDVKLDTNIKSAVLESCAKTGCYWAYRRIGEDKKTDHGADFFAFTRAWWFMHQHLYPDLLAGYYWWDDVLVRMMRWSGCLEQERLYYHEPHAQGGQARLHSAGHRHNESLALAWLGQHHELNQKPP